MRTISNKSVQFLWLSIILVVAGCSDAPKEPIAINDMPIVSRPYTSSAQQHPRLHFHKRIKNLFGHHNTVWERMFSLYSFPDVHNERVDQELSYYLSHPDYIARIQERAAPYMHLILDEIEAKNLPGELALLPVVESAFIPEAYSHSAASGLWQFIPSTGRLFGLEQNSWYDGRRDVYASTVAATTFLKELSEEFNGDYFLALASYNYGKGNIAKAISRNEYQGLPTDYWSLDLPKETEDYVPRLLAIAKLFANAEQYGIRLQDIPNKPYCEVVNVGSQLDIDKAAELAQTPLNHFLKLNPCFKKGSTAPNGPHRLLVPSHRVQTFKQNLARLPYEERVSQRQRDEELLAEKIHQNELMAEKIRDQEEERLENQRKHEVIAAKAQYYAPTTPTEQYKVHRGESLSLIAKNHGTTVDNLRQMNRLSKSSVNSGSYLKIPASKHASSSINEINKAPKTKAVGGQIYTVKKRDTFFNVSKRFAVSRTNIAAWNNISPDSNLRLGQKLVIKSSVQQLASVSPTRLIRYTVKRGDSLMQLSRKFGVSLGDLRKSNPDAANKGLRPGQNIKIVVDNSDRAT